MSEIYKNDLAVSKFNLIHPVFIFSTSTQSMQRTDTNMQIRKTNDSLYHKKKNKLPTLQKAMKIIALLSKQEELGLPMT